MDKTRWRLAGAATLLCALLHSAAPAEAQPYGWGWSPEPRWGPDYRGPGYGWGPRYGWDDRRGGDWNRPGRYGRGPDGDGPGFMFRFRSIDEDGDGLISDDEAAANVESVYYAIDADDDGFLTLDEFMAVRMGPQRGYNPARRQAREAAKRDRFEVMDGDGDGKVSKAGFLEAGRKRFVSADTDGDGRVTPWEFRSQHRY